MHQRTGAFAVARGDEGVVRWCLFAETKLAGAPRGLILDEEDALVMAEVRWLLCDIATKGIVDLDDVELYLSQSDAVAQFYIIIFLHKVYPPLIAPRE